MDELHDVIEYLEGHGIEVFKPNYKKERFGMRCPFCGDSRDPSHYHVQVKYLPQGTRHNSKAFWGFRCNRCGEGGTLNSILKKLGVKATVQTVKGKKSVSELLKLAKGVKEEEYKEWMFGHFKPKVEVNEEDLIYRPAFIKGAFKYNRLARQGLIYLCKMRNFGFPFIASHLKKGDMIIGSNPLLLHSRSYDLRELYGRVIFVSFNSVFAQGRLFVPVDTRGKYHIYRKPKAEYGDVIAFEGSSRKYLVIVEGPFDALRAHLHGVSSLSLQGEGKFTDLEFSYEHFGKTRNFISQHDKILLWLDQDVQLNAIHKMRQNISRLIKKEVLICDIFGKYKEPDEVQKWSEWNEILKGLKNLPKFDGSIYE